MKNIDDVLASALANVPDRYLVQYGRAVDKYCAEDRMGARMEFRELSRRAEQISSATLGAAAHEFLAVIEREDGAADASLEHYLVAEQLLADCAEMITNSTAVTDFRGRIRLQIAQALLRIDANKRGFAYVELALEDLSNPDLRFRAWSLSEHIRIQRVDDSGERLHRYRAFVAELETKFLESHDRGDGQTDGIVRVLLSIKDRLARELVLSDVSENVREGFELAAESCALIVDIDQDEFVNYSSIFAMYGGTVEVDISDLLKELVPLAWSLATKSTNRLFVARAEMLAAVQARQLGDLRWAIACCLDAIETTTSILTDTKSSQVRAGISEDLDFLFDLGLRLADLVGDTHLIAELLESAKLQCAPVLRQREGLAQSDTAQRVIPTSLADLLSPSPLSAKCYVAVNGRSHLRDRQRGSGSSIELSDMVVKVAGSEAWWWSVRVHYDAICWAVRDPKGEIESGRTTMTGNLLKMIFDRIALYRNVEAWAGDPINEVLEAAESFTLLASMISGRLLELLSTTESPLRIVVSGTEFLNWALPSMCVSPVTDRRLVEAATLHVQAPAPILDAIVFSNADVYHRLLSCTDPTGDLPNSFHSNDDSFFRLAGSRHVDGDIRLASVDNVLGALRRCGRGGAGIWFYSGHAAGSEFGYDLESALRLADGDLTARMILERSAADQRFGVPARILISACDSSGVAGAVSGQWLGLSAAMLCSGASEVIATAWRIPDWPRTHDFEEELWNRLEGSTDAAACLAGLQREYLVEWRSAESEYRRIMWSPVMWAAFHCTGIRPPE